MSKFVITFRRCTGLLPLFIFTLILAGCGTQPAAPGTQPATQDQPHDYAIYVADTPLGLLMPSAPLVAGFHVSADGMAQPMQGSPFAAAQGIAQLLAGNEGSFLFVNSLDSYDFTTGVLGPDRGLFRLSINPDGSLGTPVRVTHTFFPLALSPSGNALYASEASDEVFGHPIELNTYSVDQKTGSLSLMPNAAMAIDGQESFDGQMTQPAPGFWIKTSLNGTSSLMTFVHFDTDPASGAPLNSTRLTIPNATDLYSSSLAASNHFLLVVDGTAVSQAVVRVFGLQAGTVSLLQNCFDPSQCNIIHAAIDPREHFAFLLSNDAVTVAPLNLANGLDFSHATSVPLSSMPAPPIVSALNLSPDGKLLAVARNHQLEIFAVGPDGSLMALQGSPFQLPQPIGEPANLLIVQLPQH
jgi:hypothetical protein